MNTLNKLTLRMGAAMVVGSMMTNEAHAQQDFSTISENIITSIQDLPSLLSGLSYMMGILLGVLGVLKIKDHVENPSNAPLKDGAIRLAAGGGLFALPIVYEAMQATVGQGQAVNTPQLNQIQFN